MDEPNDLGTAGADNLDNQEGGYTINDVNEVLGDFKDDPVFKPHLGKAPKDFVTDVLKGYVNAQKMIGGDKVVIPQGKLDTPEAWNALYDKLGRPQDPEGYKLEKPTLPEGMNYDENLEKAFKALCHQNGLLPKQAAAVYDLWNQITTAGFNSQVETKKQQAAETLAALRTEWPTQDAFEGGLKLANEVLSQYSGDKEAMERLIEKNEHDLDFIKLMHNIGKVMSEDSLKLGEKRFDWSGDDTNAALQDILHNKDNVLHTAYWTKAHPQHAAAVAEVQRLMTLKHGDKPINMT